MNVIHLRDACDHSALGKLCSTKCLQLEQRGQDELLLPARGASQRQHPHCSLPQGLQLHSLLSSGGIPHQTPLGISTAIPQARGDSGLANTCSHVEAPAGLGEAKCNPS